MDNNEMKALERKLRRIAQKQGYSLRKSRDRSISIDNLGEYMIVDTENNCIVAGGKFDLTLENVAELLKP